MTTSCKYPIIYRITLPQEKDIQLRKEIALEADKRHQKILGTIIPYASHEELPEVVKEQLAILPRTDRKPKVLTLYYGGTLGMHWEEKGGQKVLLPTEDAKELLQPLEKWGLSDKMHIVWFPVLKRPIDSTNARWPHWVSIGNALKLLYDDFDGFVVAGGTDTLRFMTASMHFMFPNFGKPNIAAAAQKEAGSWGSDAPENLAFSFETACSDISGAHLALARKIRDGRHIFKIKDREYEAFDSPQRYILGHFDGNVNLYPNHPRRNPLVNSGNLQYSPYFRDGIFSTEIQPFMETGTLLHLSTDPLTQAILFVTYEAGNIRNQPQYEGELTHVDVVKQLHGKRFPFVLGSPMQDGRVESPYDPGVEAIQGGAISGGDTTGASLLVKMSRVLYDSWWTDEKREAAYLYDRSGESSFQFGSIYERKAKTRHGVNYKEFRYRMYQDYVGELGMDIKDKAPVGEDDDLIGR